MEIRNWRTGEVIYQAKANTFKELVEKAVKVGVSLNCANLKSADLEGADLRCAYLRGANLRCAYLRGANLRCADLRDAIFFDADLSYATFFDADLRHAMFNDADLNCANLRTSDLNDAYLSSAINIPENLPMACPKDGSFVAWKKVNDKLVKLEIPEDAKRSSATSNKCRCDKAKVLAITDLDGTNPINEVINLNFGKTIYRVNEMVYPDCFDDNRWRECSHGIHFFMDKQNAIDY